MSLEHDTTMATDAQGRVISQYREAPNFMALIGQLGGQVQLVEDALWDLYEAAFIDTATDVWLEYIGSIVGEAREGWDDVTYLRLIRARILANRSSGTIDEVFEVLGAALDLDPTLLFNNVNDAKEFYPASMLLILEVSINPSLELQNRMVRIVARARPTGVRLMINIIPGEDITFQMGDSGEAQPQIDALQGFGDSSDPSTGGMFANGNLA